MKAKNSLDSKSTAEVSVDDSTRARNSSAQDTKRGDYSKFHVEDMLDATDRGVSADARLFGATVAIIWAGVSCRRRWSNGQIAKGCTLC